MSGMKSFGSQMVRDSALLYIRSYHIDAETTLMFRPVQAKQRPKCYSDVKLVQTLLLKIWFWGDISVNFGQILNIKRPKIGIFDRNATA